MMSTLEASQDIRTLPGDMQDIVDKSFSLENHKDFKDDDSIETTPQDPSGDSNLEAAPEDPSEVDKSAEEDPGEVENVESEVRLSDDKTPADSPENCENVLDGLQPLSNGSGVESECLDTPKDSVGSVSDVNDGDSQEVTEMPLVAEDSTQDDVDEDKNVDLGIEDEKEGHENSEMPNNLPDDTADMSAEMSVDVSPDIDAQIDESIPEPTTPKASELEDINPESDGPIALPDDITPYEDDAVKPSESEDVSLSEESTLKNPNSEDVDMKENDAEEDEDVALEEKSPSDDIINLDDMLKEIGVDNTETTQESSLENKKQDTVSENIPVVEDKKQEIEDDDVLMMDLDEATEPESNVQDKVADKDDDAVPESKSTDIKESIKEQDDDIGADLCNDILNECDELLKSIDDDKGSDENPTISLDEDSSDILAKDEVPEKKLPDSNDTEKADESEEKESETVLQEEKVEPEVGETESQAEEVAKISEKEDAEHVEPDPEIADKSQGDLGNSSDDVLIIDDESQSQDVKKSTEDSVQKDTEKTAPENQSENEKTDEILKATEMDIEEETSTAEAEATKDSEEPPKNHLSEEPIPIDDDDLSMDDKVTENPFTDDSMDKMGSELSKKRPSNSFVYEEKSKRMKLSDESEKDTDTNSQSSVQSKKDVDVNDSLSRQSERENENSGDSLKMTLRLKRDKGKLEVEKISQAEKDVGSLLTPLPKKTSMEFMTRFKKPFQDMSHSDLEDFVLQKIAELITHKSEYSEMRKKLDKQEEMISFYRSKLTELSKNFHDLEVVYKRVQQDLDNRNSGYVQIPKITRAVGLQVSVSSHRNKHSQNTSQTDHSRTEIVTRASASAQEAAKKMKPIQRFTPMRPPMSEAEQRNLDAQEQKQRQEMQQQVQQKLALNAVNTTSGTTTIAQRNSNIVVLKHTPKPPQTKIISPQPYVVKRTAVRTSTITSTVVTKTVSPAGQTQQRVILTPSSAAQQHAQQSQSIHKVTMAPQQRSPTVVSPPKKQVVVDLTDEDDSNKAKAVLQQTKSSVSQTLINGGIPALVAIPSSASSSKPSSTKYVMVQQMQATNGQLAKTMPNKYVAIAPKPSSEQPMRTVVTPQQTVVRRPPMATTIVASGSGQMRPTVKIMNPQRTHPAPLPPFQNQPSQYGMKRIPTRPVIRIKNDEKQGIVISWTMDDLTDDHEEIRDYQIYAYQETSAPPSTENWRLVGDVKSMMLPMAVTLSQFQEGQRYWFAVRARDIHERCGMFSVPRTW
ncbi:activating transcription factor 7-interacting protein 1 isoform X3 [Phlebotomus papatasi]|uniref:activating transcription factor 7-interacting protein 1 isoform X3 n=1 Tax=Phlebotomus papatasi TaxID=29031 RepID=UPI0024844EE5|nr:activating transcription factor 7-interacting protein 1 isoform X3 [Phlebotomus papatasi]